MELDKNIITRIDQLLENSSDLVPADLVSQDGTNKKVVSSQDLVKNMWNCLVCGAQLHIKNVECPMCKIFRPIETYDNIIHNPEKVTGAELEALKSRRSDDIFALHLPCGAPVVDHERLQRSLRCLKIFHTYQLGH